MVSLSEWFGQLLFGSGSENQAVAVIGSGGKTSLIWHLAATLSPGRRVLVTPTAKMLVPEKTIYDRYYGDTLPVSSPGVTLGGVFNRTSGKLESYPLTDLERIVPEYNLVLLEADGSRGLPLKAWNEREPVIPEYTDLTIGILPLWPLGKSLTKKIVHREDLFMALTGASEGEKLKAEHIIKLITGGNAGRAGAQERPGLFTRSYGRKILFFNQIEDEEQMLKARELARLLPQKFRTGLCTIAAGSVKANTLEVLS